MSDGTERNVALLLTPPGSAAIAVVRLRGPRVAQFLQSNFSGIAKPGRPVHGTLRDHERVIDDPVVMLHKNQCVADINLHGGAWVVQACLDLAKRAGFDIVDQTRLPLDARAVDADSVLESEMLTHLPLASTELALRALLAQPDAWMTLRSETLHAHDKIEDILDDRSLHWLLHPPRVAIVGAANVGKSTLANQLFARERSITADVPGTTRDWVGELANLDGLVVMLVDTPGDRQTNDAIERAAIARSAGEIAQSDLVVLVLDATRPLDPERSPLLARHPDALVLLNKVDRPRALVHPSTRAIPTVATTGQGVDELRRSIRRHFGCESFDLARPRVWTDRQRDILRRALDFPQILGEIWGSADA